MKKLLHNLLIIFLFLALIACAAEDEIVVVTPDPSLVPFTLPTATFPPLPPTPPLPPPAEHLPLAPPPEIPVIMAEFEASKQGKVIAGLTDPEARRLYALDERGLLLIFNLDDYRQLASVETGLDRRSGGGFYFNQLALDAGRRRLYLSGDPIQILATDTFQLTPQPDLRGQLTPDPASDRLYLTPPCVCQMEQCNTLILNVNTLTSAETLFPPQNPLAATINFSTPTSTMASPAPTAAFIFPYLMFRPGPGLFTLKMRPVLARPLLTRCNSVFLRRASAWV